MPGMSQVIYNEGLSDGISQGVSQGKSQMVIELVHDGDITIDRAAKKLNKSPDEIQQLLNDLVAYSGDIK